MRTLTPQPPESLVLGQLKASAEQLQRAKEARIRAIRMGRAAGIKWSTIGDQLGISGVACIQLIQRADKAN